MISRKSSVITVLLCSKLNTSRRLWVVSLFALVMIGSTYTRNALALATVVLIRLWISSEFAIFESIACRCEVVLPKWLKFFFFFFFFFLFLFFFFFFLS